jgi:hypothetical protein
MPDEVPDDIKWLAPWQPVKSAGDNLVKELRQELSEYHILHGVRVVAVARRVDRDDVLFTTADPAKPLAVVHLTFTGDREREPQWPWTTIYNNWQDWIDRCMLPDHWHYAQDE